jgi:hypothetical protein
VAVSFNGGGNLRKPLNCRKSLTNLSHNVVHLTLSGVEPTTSVVIGIECIGSCKSNYHTTMAMTASTSVGNNMHNKTKYIYIYDRQIIITNVWPNGQDGRYLK